MNNNKKYSTIINSSIGYNKANNNYFINSARTQNNKKNTYTHIIKIDLSKYNNNSQKETKILNNNIKVAKPLNNNNINIYVSKYSNKNNTINNESKSRYINRSSRGDNNILKSNNLKGNSKIKYKKLDLNLSKDKISNKNNNKYISTDINTNKNIKGTILNSNNIIFNNKLNNRRNNINNINKERENYYKNLKNNEINRIENIHVYNNINRRKKIEESKEPENIIKKNEIIIDEINDENDIQENFCYDKDLMKENILSDENMDFLKKYIDNNKKNEIHEEIHINNINNNYINYLKKEENALNKNLVNNTENIETKKNDIKNINNKITIKESPNIAILNNINQPKDKNINNNESTKINYNIYDYNNYYGTLKESRYNNNSYEIDIIKNEKQFDNLIPKKPFRKFLTSKIKYYMKENSIPKKFILEFINQKNYIKPDGKIISLSQEKNGFNNLKEYYENDDYYIAKKKKKKNALKEEKNSLVNEIKNLKIYLDNSKSEIEKKNEEIKSYLMTYDRIMGENEKNIKKIKNLENILDAKNNEVEEKNNKINELNNINNQLEKQMKKLKEEYINESINNKETKKSYSLIKNNYYDIKNQYDLLNIKYKTLSDENYNYKRDKILYEKEIKTKNNFIDDLIRGDKNRNKTKKKETPIKNEEEKKENNFEEYNNIEELMNIRDELVGERNFINNEFYKIPTKANYKQNERKNELEKRISQINSDLAKIRIRINILKGLKNINIKLV
jgi:hypothetical protein